MQGVHILPADPNVQAENADHQPIGSVVDERYRILEVAGHGGMGVVYKAEHVHISRIFALKMLLREAYSDEQAFKRFKQEARAASQLSHPHIVGIHDFGILEGNQPYLAMDFLAGEGLNSIFKKGGPLSFTRFEHVFSQACDALQHAHQHGVVHRDVKPSNIVLTERDGDRDFVVIVDFGLVKLMSGSGDQKLTSTDMLVGSPLYMSPEQCRGKNVDHRTDIYSLGCCMYEALTACVPFAGENPLDTLYKHVSEPPVPMKLVNPNVYVPPAVEQVVMKALSKEPAERQQSMAQLQEELEQALQGAAPLMCAKNSDAPGAPSAPAVLPGRDSLSESDSQSTRISVVQPNLNSQASIVSTTNQAGSGTNVVALEPGGKSSGSIWLAVIVIACIAAAIIGSLLTIIYIQKQTINQEYAELKQGHGVQTPATPSPVATAPLPSAVVPAAPSSPVKTSPAVKAENKAAKLGKMQSTEQLLQDQADSSFESQNWKLARELYQKCLPMQEKLFGEHNELLLPVLAKMTICSWQLEDADATAESLNRFADLYSEHPALIAHDERLLNQLFDLTYSRHSLPLADQLIRATIKAHDEKLSTADFGSFNLRFELARVLGEEQQPHRQEEVLRQIFDTSTKFPMIRQRARIALVELLTQQNRLDEVQQLGPQENNESGPFPPKNGRRFNGFGRNFFRHPPQ